MSKRGKARSKAIHDVEAKKVRRFKKSPGLCLTCYEFVNHLYITNGGKSECYHCSRGIQRR